MPEMLIEGDMANKAPAQDRPHCGPAGGGRSTACRHRAEHRRCAKRERLMRQARQTGHLPVPPDGMALPMTPQACLTMPTDLIAPTHAGHPNRLGIGSDCSREALRMQSSHSTVHYT
jgi:hypothetical protein